MAQWPDRCVQPGVVTNDDLLACARGEATRSVVEHVMACPACRARVAMYEALERRLLAGLYAPPCPESLTLAEFALDLLPTEQRAAVLDHLARCPHCRAVVRFFRVRLGSPGASALLELEEEEGPPSDERGRLRATATAAAAARAIAACGVRLILNMHCAPRSGGGGVIAGGL